MTEGTTAPRATIDAVDTPQTGIVFYGRRNRALCDRTDHIFQGFSPVTSNLASWVGSGWVGRVAPADQT